MYFHPGERVVMTRENYKIVKGAVGTVMGVREWWDEEEEEWIEDDYEVLVKFDVPYANVLLESDWDEREDQVHDPNCFYIPFHLLERTDITSFMQFKQNQVENRHHEHKKRMLLRHRSG